MVEAETVWSGRVTLCLPQEAVYVADPNLRLTLILWQSLLAA